MASFWSLSNGAAPTGEVSDNSGFKPILKTWCKSMFEEATVREWEGVKSVNLKARIIDGEHKNRVVFLKLKCWDNDSSKRDAAINKATKISQVLGVPQPKCEPDDEYFSQWVDKPLDLLIDTVIPKDGSKPDGYPWLVNVESKGTKAGVAQEKAKPQREPGEDVDLPF